MKRAFQGLFSFGATLLISCQQIGPVKIELHDAVDPMIRYVGPIVEENSEAFLDHRYWMELTPETHSEPIIIEGYLDQITSEGGIWTVKLAALPPGPYRMEEKFCSGANVALDGCEGTVIKSAELLLHTQDNVLWQRETRYLQYPNGTVFLKTGAGSPENILAYTDFDGTYDAGGQNFPALGEDQLHEFEAHLKDARSDDPTWDEGKGAALLGLFNYYEKVGVNSQYLVAMNIHGDGWDVSPWVSHDDPYVFDVSKLAQWQRVFEHANRRGVAIHMLFTETENESFFEVHDSLQTGENFAPSRKLYYREMVARFGHLPLIIWNLGEENGVVGNTGADPYRQPTSAAQRQAFSEYIAALDARTHPIVSHNWPDLEEDTYGPLLGNSSFSGISLQAHHHYFDKVAEWTERSKVAGRPWMVSVDEPLGWEFGARPDSDVEVRREILEVLWPTLLGGGTGVEWYFGWQNNAPTSDLSNEDQRSRHRLWTASTKVRRFFETLPLIEMTPRRDGEMMILEGAGHRLEMVGDVVSYTTPDGSQKLLDPYDPE